MDGWPKINTTKGSSTSSRPAANGLPAPGTVVMANVDEDLGEGKYSLRWGQNRIAVNSQSPLKTGQSLILRSEMSAEGKITLVVQGPAIPDPGSITGRVIYGPAKQQPEKSPVQEDPGQQAATYGPANKQGRDVGNQMAAGVSRATVVQTPQPVQSLVGLVLEPLPDLKASVAILQDAVEEEKKKLEGEEGEEQKNAAAEEGEGQDGETGDVDAAGKKRRPLARPADPAAGQAGRPGQPAQPIPGQVGQTAMPGVSPGQPGGGQATAPAPSAPAQQGTPPSTAERPPPVLTESGPRVPDVPETAGRPQPDQPGQAQPQRPDAPASTVPSGPQTQPSPAPGGGVSQQPPVVAAPGPVVPDGTVSPPTSSPQQQTPAERPDQSSSPNNQQTTPTPGPTPPATGSAAPGGAGQTTGAQQPAPLPGAAQPAPGPVVPDVPVAPPSGGQPSVSTPGSPSQPPPPSGQQPAPLPGAAQPAPGPVVPDVPVAPPSGGQPPVSTPGSPSQPPPPSGQQPAPLPGAAQPAPGPVVPDVPVAPPSGGQPPASTPGSPSQPPSPSGQQPAPLPGAAQPTPGTVPQPAAPDVVVQAPGPVQPGSTGTAQPAQPVGTGPIVPEVPASSANPQTPSVQPAQPSPTPASPPQSSPQGTPPSSPVYGYPTQHNPYAQHPQQPPPAVIQGQGPVVPDVPAASPPAQTPPSGQPPPAPGHTPPPSPANHAAPDINPDVYQKEALTQMAKASELPLSDDTDTRVLGKGGRMPDAVVDKAATIFLRAAGLTPDDATLEAARALVRNNVQVDRETVQALMTMAAGAPEGERDAAVKAAARLAAKDIPIAQPLVSGLADVMSRTAGPSDLMRQAVEALAPPETAPPEAQTLMRSAQELLDLLHVDLDQADAPLALERYVSTFGRETLGKALALVEVSTQAVLENHPALQAVDQALGQIFSLLEGDMGAHEHLQEGATPQTGQTAGPPAASATGTGAPAQAAPGEPVAAQPLPAQLEPVPMPSGETAPGPAAPPRAPINAYINAPRALRIADMLKNLPPMPKIVNINDPVPQQQQTPAPPPAAQTTQAGPAQQPQQTAPQPPADGGVREGAKPEQPQAQEPVPLRHQPPLPERQGSALLMKLDSLFQTPGLNKAEFELLKPGGFLERYMNSASEGPNGATVKQEAERLFRELTSQNRDGVEKALRELHGKDPEVLRETAARLTKHEAEIMRGDPLLNKLSDAASNLRDLGRQALAVKAENVAGQDRNPGVMLAEVPFKLNDDAGDGRMQMFYRKGKGKHDGWSSRVILDLNTTRMGPVLGDLRFFGQDMMVNMFVERQELAEYLERESETLIDGLWGKGFRVKTRFMVLPTPAQTAPQIHAERPEIAGETPDEGGGRSDTGIHRLDIKG